MTVLSTVLWTRRRWLTSNVLTLAAVVPRQALFGFRGATLGIPSTAPERVARATAQAERLDLTPWQALAQRAVDAAHTAGAHYAEARLTRQVVHNYNFLGGFDRDAEVVGVGVRALVDGYWAFSASNTTAPDEVVRLAQDAVAQARAAAHGAPAWTVDLGKIPVATGTWTTPIRIDPFEISIEEKIDYMDTIKRLAEEAGGPLVGEGIKSYFRFLREERVVVTTAGASFAQTIYESVGYVLSQLNNNASQNMAQQWMGNMLGIGTSNVPAWGLELAGAGWELILDANVPDQFISGRLIDALHTEAAIRSKPFQIGRYPLVFDGATMGRVLETTLGGATQLDRALGYQANTVGTSAITDPLAMVGNLRVAASLVTITANRSAPRQLATVKWDDEGVAPEPFTLVKDGVLTDFQTTREQAAWLAPYYERHGMPVRSHGCAVAESAHFAPIQQMPNLALEPSTASIRQEDLIADVQHGVLVEQGTIVTSDSQARTGLLVAGGDFGGRMREIKNGKLGDILTGGAVLFNSQELWKKMTAIGGPSTQAVVATSKEADLNGQTGRVMRIAGYTIGKGHPPQFASHSVRAAAATLPPQPLIDPVRKA